MNRSFEPLSPEERALAERLSRLDAHREPAPALDAAILAAARAAVRSEKTVEPLTAAAMPAPQTAASATTTTDDRTETGAADLHRQYRSGQPGCSRALALAAHDPCANAACPLSPQACRHRYRHRLLRGQ